MAAILLKSATTGLAAEFATATVKVDTTQRFQTIEGFGVNFNGVYYRQAQKRLLDLLIDDLGASIVRFDPFGQSDWEIQNDDGDPHHINWSVFDDRFSTAAFEASWAAMRAFNQRGIRVLLNVSGTVPAWMLDDKGKPLVPGTCRKEPNPVHRFTNRPSHLRSDMYAEFAETVVALASYARNKAKVRFEWFGPLNETNCYPIEGPRVDPDEAPRLMKEVLTALDREGLADVNVVFADQAGAGSDYFSPIFSEPDLMKRVARFTLHQYGQLAEGYADHFKRIGASAFRDVPIWISEYGDLNDKDRSAANEWTSFCIKGTQRILDLLGMGATAGLWWDAFDNYHDHDKQMTFYGLVANENHVYAPKKRFYAQRQLYRFVRPGAQRVASTSDNADLTVQTFVHKGRVTVVGVANNAMTVEVPLGRRLLSGQWNLTVTTPSRNGERADKQLRRDDEAFRITLDEPSVFTLSQR